MHGCYPWVDSLPSVIIFFDMDLKGYEAFRKKLNQLMEVINNSKYSVLPERGGTVNQDGMGIPSKEHLKRLADVSEEWLDLAEDINDQIKEKKQILIRSRAKMLERNQPSLEDEFQ